MNDHIFIYGPPGVGKSTIGKHLAEALNLPFIDLDEKIVLVAQKTIPEIFSEEGEAQFRSYEQEQLLQAIDNSDGVIALGGGALINPQNRKLTESNGQVVLLAASPENLLERLQKSKSIRPLIAKDTIKKLGILLQQRKEHYDSFKLRCQTDSRSPEDLVWDIQERLGKFYITGMGKGYPVHVKSGSIAQIGTLLAPQHSGRNVLLITDENVGPLYADEVHKSLNSSGFEVHSLFIKAGEAHKNLETVSQIWSTMAEGKLDRQSLVVALGGGVVGDMAGFAAATYMRGIEWVNIASSLLSMVDASIGGKTAFDLPQGKNLVGAFHPPKFVLIDPNLLSTLPELELKNGLGEVVKHGIIDSPQLLELCQKDWQHSPVEQVQFLSKALSVKVKMVQMDPFEKGIRATLNLGHTVGHAVELLSDFQLPHGYAVAIGMVAEARLAQHIGMVDQEFIKQLVDILQHLGLPTDIPGTIDKNKIIEIMQIDKKNAGKQIRFALPKAVGHIEVGIVIDDLETIFAQL